MGRVTGWGMSLMTYLILGIVSLYLFKVNPVLCVVIMGAIVFFKIRGAFGGRHTKGQERGSAATEVALAAMCITLLERSERGQQYAGYGNVKSRSIGDDPLDGLFLN
jgi:hypothetical protein